VLESRWLRWVPPGVIALIAVASVVSTTLGGGPKPWQQRACGPEIGSPAAAARSAAPADLHALRDEAWFRLDPRLDRQGALQGQRLAFGINRDRTSRRMDLPAESFAAGPFGAIVLVGTDDGAASRLEAVNVEAQCSWPLATEAAVIRRATIDPAGATLYESRVDRATRADLGIWARPLDGSRPPIRVLDPIEPDERFGRTFATEFAWDLVGTSVAVSSCGELACRTRVLDPGSGVIRTVAEPDLGMPVGLAGDALVSYAACPGVPCPIVATDLASGTRTKLTEAGSSAVTVMTPDGPRLVHEVIADDGVELRSVSLDGSAQQDLGQLAGDQRLQPAAAAANAATRVPPGWVVLEPDGRLPETGPGAETKLRHVPDGTTVQLDEVAQ
jgi:hypothetical protein